MVDLCDDCGTEADTLRDGVCFRCRMLSIQFGSHAKLAAEREGGYTQRQLVKETIDAAKADGRDIRSAKSGRWI